jgi:ribosomal protein S18 acetylase RimI-like enzyme
VIKALSPHELEAALPTFVELLQESVDEGASLGFLAPLAARDALEYWQSLQPDLESGSRVLLAACEQGRIVGSGQLALPAWSNGKHRASIEKLIVSAASRRRGIGKALVAALQDAARLRGRSLLLINARRADPAELLYKRMGYREFGVIPGYTTGPGGQRYDNVCLYRELPLS